MCSNILVKKISFTGSTRVGKQLMKLGSDTVKRLSLGKRKSKYIESRCFSTLVLHISGQLKEESFFFLFDLSAIPFF
jgi:hypothetical protein